MKQKGLTIGTIKDYVLHSLLQVTSFYVTTPSKSIKYIENNLTCYFKRIFKAATEAFYIKTMRISIILYYASQ